MRLRTLLSVLFFLFFIFVAVLPSATQAGHVTLVKDPWPEGWGTQPMELTVLNGVLYFNVWTPEFGRELWRSDGTTAGTTIVKDIYPGPNDGSPMHLTASGGKLFFTASDGTDIELFVSDGTDAGTVKLDINPAGSSYPDWLTDVNGTLFCAATHSVSGRELWKSDGTIGGTVVVTEINFPPFVDTNPTELEAVGNLLYFSGSFLGFPGNPPVACVTDGTGPGTHGLGAPSPREFTAVGPRVFFVSNSELWSWNGSSAAMVKKVNPSAPSDARDLAAFGNILLFSVDDGINGNELWRSDGTAAGTYMVKDINTQPVGYPQQGYAYPRSFTTFGGVSLFSAYEPSTGRELWATDGTSAGTVLVSDIAPGPPGYFDLYLAEGRGAMFQGEFYFGYDDGIHGYELWRTDGSAAGTKLVADVWPNPGASNVSYLVTMGDALYFVAYGDQIGDALWRYDPAATAVSDRTPGRDVLLQNTPNPFNPQTRIAFELGQGKRVTLSVFDVQGKLVRTLIDRNLPSGHHEEVWDGRDANGQVQSSGVYFLKLRTPDRTLTRKMVLLK